MNQRAACVGIIGLGYVGLPLLIEFAKENFKMIGFDLDQSKIDQQKIDVQFFKESKIIGA